MNGFKKMLYIYCVDFILGNIVTLTMARNGELVDPKNLPKLIVTLSHAWIMCHGPVIFILHKIFNVDPATLHLKILGSFRAIPLVAVWCLQMPVLVWLGVYIWKKVKAWRDSSRSVSRA
jgi:hypothetical protein